MHILNYVANYEIYSLFQAKNITNTHKNINKDGFPGVAGSISGNMFILLKFLYLCSL